MGGGAQPVRACARAVPRAGRVHAGRLRAAGPGGPGARQDAAHAGPRHVRPRRPARAAACSGPPPCAAGPRAPLSCTRPAAAALTGGRRAGARRGTRGASRCTRCCARWATRATCSSSAATTTPCRARRARPSLPKTGTPKTTAAPAAPPTAPRAARAAGARPGPPASVRCSTNSRRATAGAVTRGGAGGRRPACPRSGSPGAGQHRCRKPPGAELAAARSRAGTGKVARKALGSAQTFCALCRIQCMQLLGCSRRTRTAAAAAGPAATACAVLGQGAVRSGRLGGVPCCGGVCACVLARHPWGFSARCSFAATAGILASSSASSPAAPACPRVLAVQSPPARLHFCCAPNVIRWLQHSRPKCAGSLRLAACLAQPSGRARPQAAPSASPRPCLPATQHSSLSLLGKQEREEACRSPARPTVRASAPSRPWRRPAANASSLNLRAGLPASGCWLQGCAAQDSHFAARSSPAAATHPRALRWPQAGIYLHFVGAGCDHRRDRPFSWKDTVREVYNCAASLLPKVRSQPRAGTPPLARPCSHCAPWPGTGAGAVAERRLLGRGVAWLAGDRAAYWHALHLGHLGHLVWRGVLVGGL